MANPRKTPEERAAALRARLEKNNRSVAILGDLSRSGQIILLDQWNSHRLSHGDPPFAHVLTVRAMSADVLASWRRETGYDHPVYRNQSIDVRCPYCRGVHRHPQADVGQFLKEMCVDAPECAIGYVAMDTHRLKLLQREAQEALRRGWIAELPKEGAVDEDEHDPSEGRD